MPRRGDPTETWTIKLPGLYDGNVELATPVTPGATATLRWNGGPPVTSACFALDAGSAACTPSAAITTRDNTALVDIPPSTPSGPTHATIELDGSAAPGAPECGGPASCRLAVVVSAKLPVTL